MKILITGGAGFIGSNLTQFHLNKNHQVTVIDNLLTGSKKNIKKFLERKDFHFIEKDLITLDFSSLKLDCFDIIYHLASPASPVKYKQYPIKTLMVNAQGTKNVLDFFLKSKSKVFVLTSTSEVYGDPLVHPQPETYWGNVNPIGKRSCYDEGKRFAESLVKNYHRKYNLDLRIARIFNTYGPNMEKNDGRVISNFLVQALTNKPVTIYGDGTQTRSFCYVSDMVNGLYKLATVNNLAGEIINIGNTDEKKIIDLANIVINFTNSKSILKYLPKLKDIDDPKRRQPNINKAKKLLSWQAKIDLKQGLEKTIKYFKTRFL